MITSFLHSTNPMISFQLATFAVLVPAVAGLAAWRRGARAARWLVVTGAGASLAASAWLLVREAAPGRDVVVDWVPGLGLAVGWRLETAPLALAILVTGVAALVLQYAGVYFAAKADASRTLALMSLFVSAMVGLVLAHDLYLLFVFWELTGILSFFLISSGRKNEDAWPAARHALLVTFGGGLTLLAGIVWIHREVGSTAWSALGPDALTPASATIALALVLPAVATKSAQLPFSTWLPRAMAAPTPASALLHSATMVKAGIILLLFLAPTLRASPLWSGALVPLGSATCVWGAYRALTVHDLKALLAYSTVSQLGLLTLTLGLGTDVAIRAAVLHLFAHAVFKAGLFLTVGSVERSAGTRRLDALGGLWRAEPALFAAALVLAGSMAGIPPLAGFLSKELILKKAMLGDAWTHGVAISGIVLGSIGTVAYSARLVADTFLGARRGEPVAARRAPVELVGPVSLALATLVAGLGAPWVDLWFLEPVAWSLVGAPIPVKPLSLWYGLNVAFLMSVGIVSVGWLCHRALGLSRLRWPARAVPISFDDGLSTVGSLGSRVERLVAGQRPTVYYGVLAVFATLAVALGFSTGFPALGPSAPGEVALVTLLALAIASLFVQRSRLGRVLALSGVGLVVALLFRRLAAPDLMLTQVSVEILTTVLFAAALAALPKGAGARVRLSWPRVGIAVAAGGALALLGLGLNAAARPGDLASRFLEDAPALAAGRNVVNVILTDFRGIDTLVETVVIGLAALGAVGLASRSRAIPPAGASERRSGLLPEVAPLVQWIGLLLAAALLFKGHDQPGGGFVAGLVGAVTWIVGALAGPVEGREARLARGLRIGLVGLALALLLPVAAGLPPLTHLHGKVEGLGWKWHSALLFEIAIALTVAAGVASAVVRFLRREST